MYECNPFRVARDAREANRTEIGEWLLYWRTQRFKQAEPPRDEDRLAYYGVLNIRDVADMIGRSVQQMARTLAD